MTPVSFDWDADGDDDLMCGNTAGEIAFIENLDGENPPRWAEPQRLAADGKVIRVQAGPNGSIQGPCEAKWGYTTISVADWNHDGLPDIVGNSIWGRVFWHENVGTRTAPELAPSRPIRVDWIGSVPKPAWNWWKPEAGTLVTQWRTTPNVVDWDNDGLNDLMMLDHEGYLAWFQRTKSSDGKLSLLPPKRIFADESGNPLRLAVESAGGSGRRKFCIVDWDGDSERDLLLDGRNVKLLRGLGETSGQWRFRDEGELDSRRLAGHDTSPTCVDWDRNSIPDLLVGAEDGFLYYLPNPRSTRK